MRDVIDLLISKRRTKLFYFIDFVVRRLLFSNFSYDCNKCLYLFYITIYIQENYHLYTEILVYCHLLTEILLNHHLYTTKLSFIYRNTCILSFINRNTSKSPFIYSKIIIYIQKYLYIVIY